MVGEQCFRHVKEPGTHHRCKKGMKRVIGLLLSLFAAAAVVLAPATASAKGGWAVAVLDPLPPIEAGEDATIGFQLLQHGVTPVDVADWPGTEIGIAVRTADRQWFTPATPSGAPGHFVSVVAVPSDVATLAMNVEWPHGLMLDERWVDVAVGAAASAGGAGGDGWLPTWTVPLLAVVAATCIVIVVLDLRRGRAVA
jgi:hypothetical protein